MNDIFDSLRSFSFGAMLGGGTLGLIYLLFPEIFPQGADLGDVSILGGLIGGGAHRLIDAWFISSFLKPTANKISYYSKLCEIILLARFNFIEPDLQRELISELTKRYFLDSSSTKEKRDLLPYR